MMGMTAKLLAAGRITADQALPRFEKSHTLLHDAQQAGQRCINILGAATNTVFTEEGDSAVMQDLAELSSWAPPIRNTSATSYNEPWLLRSASIYRAGWRSPMISPFNRARHVAPTLPNNSA
ncbi:MAG: hypothetical protein EOO38_27875 [Cytophagaceae bacterium]|nr:MAG: hypothetical protein EOO38_27875 [Cytophagaceae bacterium]